MNIEYPFLEWLLLVCFSFALTIHNVNLLPNLSTELLRLSLTLSTIGMNSIVYLYYPYQAIKKQKIKK